MAENNTTIFGIYPSHASVECGVDHLRAAGFPNTDISVLFPEVGGSKDFALETGNQAPEGAAVEEGTGDALRCLAGIGVLAIPGLGQFIASGPIMTRLAGVDGALNGIAGALMGMGIPEYEAKRYEGRVKEGGKLLSVHSDNSGHATRAREILEQTGAQDISSTEKASSGDTAGEGESEAASTPAATAGRETAGPSRDMAGIEVVRSGQERRQ